MTLEELEEEMFIHHYITYKDKEYFVEERNGKILVAWENEVDDECWWFDDFNNMVENWIIDGVAFKDFIKVAEID